MNAGQAALQRVAVLIVNFNAGPWLARTIESLRTDEASAADIIIVDNGSSDDSLDRLRRSIEVHEIEGRGTGAHRGATARADAPSLVIDPAGRNLGFAAGINRAAGQTRRELLLLLNPDCRIHPDDLVRMVTELDEHPEAGLVSGRVFDESGSEQRASRRRLPTPKRILGELLGNDVERIDLTRTTPPQVSTEVEAVSGACMLVRRSAFEAVGGMDEAYRLHFEDLDLFQRLGRAGYRIRWVPDVHILHAGGVSSSRRRAGTEIDKHRGLWRYLRQHCSTDWPPWQRPIWALALVLHLGLKLAIIPFRSADR